MARRECGEDVAVEVEGWEPTHPLDRLAKQALLFDEEGTCAILRENIASGGSLSPLREGPFFARWQRLQ